MKYSDIPITNLVKRPFVFNGALFTYKEENYLVYRANKGFKSPNIFLSKVDKQWNPVGESIQFKFPKNPGGNNLMYEDPRYFSYKGDPYISYTVINKDSGEQRQGVSKLNKELRPISVIYPKYLKNKPSNESRVITIDPLDGIAVYSNRVIEKNWVFFEFNSKLHFIYMTTPAMVVVEVDDDFNMVAEYIDVKEFNWAFGEIRGGASPVKVDNIYYHFFHSSTDIPFAKNKGKIEGRIYFIGCCTYKMDNNGVTLLQQTRVPLDIGDYRDDIKLWNNAGVFACGALYENNQFIISYGWNDTKLSKLEIYKKELEALLTPVRTMVS